MIATAIGSTHGLVPVAGGALCMASRARSIRVTSSRTIDRGTIRRKMAGFILLRTQVRFLSPAPHTTPTIEAGEQPKAQFRTAARFANPTIVGGTRPDQSSR